MGLKYPTTPPQDGDDETIAPQTNSRSLLGADPITGATRRMFVDSNHELWVRLKGSDATNLDIRDISVTRDSIKVGDGTYFLAINPDGSINVNAGTLSIAPSSAVAVGGIVGIPANTLTTIVTFTASIPINLTRIAVSGTDYAKFQLFKNTVLIETKRSGPERSIDFNFNNPLKLVATDIIDVKVIHYATGILADFESTIYGG